MANGIEGIIEGVGNASDMDQAADATAKLVGKLTKPTVVKNLLSGTWLGHQLHPMLTDLPIGAWGAASFLDLTAGRAGEDAARRLVGAGALATLPAAASGASDWADSYGPDKRVGFAHALLNVAATALQTASWAARRRGNRGVGIALSTLGMGLAAGSAYLGGHLTLVRGMGVNHAAFQDNVEEWTDVAAESDVLPDKPTRVEAKGVPVVLVNRHGTIFAMSAVCTHAGGPLDEGELVGECLRCPWHGSEFRLSDGSVTRGPASVAQPHFEVKVDAGRVLVRQPAASE